MPSVTELENAGRRAALQPVPAAPPMSQLHGEADRQRTRRRALGAGLIAAAVFVIAVPTAFVLGRDGSVQTLSAGDPVAELAPSAAAATGEPDPAPGAISQPGDDDPEIELRIGPEFSLSIDVVKGDEAGAAADAAADAADESRVIDDITVWVRTDADTAIVSALVDSDHFVEVRGPADQLDRLLDIVTSQGVHLPHLRELPLGDVDEFLEQFRSQFGEGPDHFGESPFVFGDGEDFGFFFNFDEVDPGAFPDFEEFFDRFDGFDHGTFPDMQEFLREFDEGTFPHMDRFFEGFEDGTFPDLGELFDGFGDGAFSGCIEIDIDGFGSTDSVAPAPGFRFVFPEGCDEVGD